MRSAIATSLRSLTPRFLDGVDERDLDSIVAAATLRRFLAHSVISNEGHAADQLFLLLSGRVRRFFITPDGQKSVLIRVLPGEIFGEATLLSRSVNYIISAEAITNSSALVWSRATIRQLSAQCPRLLENTLLITFDYLVAYRAVHTSLLYDSARQRLAQVLGNLVSGIGRNVAEGVELDIRNEELANEANVSIFTTSRLLSEWQRQGILVKRRGKVLLLSPELLLQQASQDQA